MLRYKTLVISDLDLKSSISGKLNKLLSEVSFDKLVLSGNFANKWFDNSTKPTSESCQVFKKILFKKIAKDKSEVVFLNTKFSSDSYKEDFQDEISNTVTSDFSDKISFSKKLIFEMGGKNYYMSSRDLVLKYLEKKKGINHIDYLKYFIMDSTNKMYNEFRNKRELSYKPLLKALSFEIEEYSPGFKLYLSNLSFKKNCAGIILSHYGKPYQKHCEGISIINNGFWIENASILTEDMSGKISMKTYDELLEESREAQYFKAFQNDFFTTRKQVVKNGR